MITQEQIDLANSPLGITLGFGPVRSTDGQIGCASHKDDNSRIGERKASARANLSGAEQRVGVV